MNISKHAIFRYATRVNKDIIVSDRTFPMFEKDNLELVEKYKNDIEKLANESMNIGEFKFDNKSAFFSIHKEEMVVFVLSTKDSTVVTLYDIDYDLDSVGNKQMLDILLGNHTRVQEQIDMFDSIQEERVAKIEEEISAINRSINDLEAELRILNTRKSTLSDNIVISKTERSKMFNNLGAISERICRPKYAK